MRLGLSRTRNRNLKGVGIFFTLFFLIFLIWLIFTKLQPSFIEYAKVYSNNIANEVVNSAVDDVFVKEEYQSLAKIMENSSEYKGNRNGYRKDQSLKIGNNTVNAEKY